MMEKYIEILKASGADAWEAVKTKTRGWEFYFIGHRLDQNRAVDVETISLTVYKLDAERKSLGIANAVVAPTETEEGLKKIVTDLVYQASLVKNKPYTLNGPKPYEPVKADLRPVRDEALDVINALNGIAENEMQYVNSFEVFVNRVEKHLVNSEGVDVVEHYPTSQLDVVVNAKKDGHEIELYRLYEAGSQDKDGIRRDVEELMKFGKDRLDAVPTPVNGPMAVVFSTDAALDLYRFLLINLDTAYVIRGMSAFELGKPISEEGEGDKITLESVRILKGSPHNVACDPEGAPIQDAVLIRESVPERYVGGRMFSQYLGLEDSFRVSNWRVSGGHRTGEELRYGEFLEVVEFSDFTVDEATGDIFGEIRLAYYHDGKGNVTPVSGGSISGSMIDNLSDLKMSEERRIYSNAEIPAVTRLAHMSVAGVEAPLEEK